jgi:hypothetical protein
VASEQGQQQQLRLLYDCSPTVHPAGQGAAPKCNLTFNRLKVALTLALVLEFPNFNHPYMDMLKMAIGAVLSQKDGEGHDHVVEHSLSCSFLSIFHTPYFSHL